MKNKIYSLFFILIVVSSSLGIVSATPSINMTANLSQTTPALKFTDNSGNILWQFLMSPIGTQLSQNIIFYKTGLTHVRGYQFPDGNTTLAGLNQTQRWSAVQTLEDPQLNGANIAYKLITSTSYSATIYDTMIGVNSTTAGGIVTITLPSASSDTNGTYLISKINYGNNLVMVKPSSGTINSFNNYNLTSKGDSLMVISDGGSDWKTVITPIPTRIISGSSTNMLVTNAITGFTPTASAPTSTVVEATQKVFDRPVTIDQIGIVVGTGVASSTCDLGIYRSNSTGYPSVQVVGSFKNVATATSTQVVTATYSPALTLQEGTYWFANECSTSTTLTTNHIPVTALPTIGITSATGVGVSNVGYATANSFSAGSLPNPYPNGGTKLIVTPTEVFVRVTK